MEQIRMPLQKQKVIKHIKVYPNITVFPHVEEELFGMPYSPFLRDIYNPTRRTYSNTIEPRKSATRRILWRNLKLEKTRS